MSSVSSSPTSMRRVRKSAAPLPAPIVSAATADTSTNTSTATVATSSSLPMLVAPAERKTASLSPIATTGASSSKSASMTADASPADGNAIRHITPSSSPSALASASAAGGSSATSASSPTGRRVVPSSPSTVSLSSNGSGKAKSPVNIIGTAGPSTPSAASTSPSPPWNNSNDRSGALAASVGPVEGKRTDASPLASLPSLAGVSIGHYHDDHHHQHYQHDHEHDHEHDHDASFEREEGEPEDTGTGDYLDSNNNNNSTNNGANNVPLTPATAFGVAAAAARARRSPSQSAADAFSATPESKQRTILREGEMPSSCVWVGNVSPNLPHDEFQKAFDVFGEVILVRMFPSSKCAFVTFKERAAALKSLALEGKPLADMNLTLNIGKASKHLWVGNINELVTDQDLLIAFSVHGEIESVRVLKANQCAFVNFVNDADAVKAAEIMNGTELGGQRIVINFQWEDNFKRGDRKGRQKRQTNTIGDAANGHVSHANTNGVAERRQSQASSSSSSSSASSSSSSSHQQQRHQGGSLHGGHHGRGNNASVLPSSVHVAALSALDPTLAGMQAAASAYGSPALFPSGAATFGLSAAAARQYMDHAQRGYPSPSRQLFIGNLVGSVTEEALVALFSRFGEVETIKSFSNRGYAFVVYASLRVAMYVREQMNLYPPFLGGRPLVVNFGRHMDDQLLAKYGAHSPQISSLGLPLHLSPQLTAAQVAAAAAGSSLPTTMSLPTSAATYANHSHAHARYTSASMPGMITPDQLAVAQQTYAHHAAAAVHHAQQAAAAQHHSQHSHAGHAHHQLEYMNQYSPYGHLSPNELSIPQSSSKQRRASPRGGNANNSGGSGHGHSNMGGYSSAPSSSAAAAAAATAARFESKNQGTAGSNGNNSNNMLSSSQGLSLSMMPLPSVSTPIVTATAAPLPSPISLSSSSSGSATAAPLPSPTGVSLTSANTGAGKKKPSKQ